jgi:phosphatidylglycerophosphatase A
MLVTFLFIPHDPRFIITGFFLFRMFDMLKVPPANILEKYSGGKGIVGDDLIAGLYANVILHLARLVIG